MVENKKTGEMENKQSVWVNCSGLTRSNFEEVLEGRIASKSFASKDTSAGTLQAIERRARGFATKLSMCVPLWFVSM